MTALPRFANPHHLAQSIETTYRSAIYHALDEGEQEIDPSLLTDLTALVKRDLGDITIVSRKRRKLKHRVETDAISEEHIVGEKSFKIYHVVLLTIVCHPPKHTDYCLHLFRPRIFVWTSSLRPK